MDIQKLVTEHHKQGGGVVLMIDANKDCGIERQGELAEFMLATQLKDVYKARHKMTPTTTYAREVKRLDYIFISHHLLGTVRKLGYLALHDGVISDHKMCFIEVNMTTFLGGNVNQILMLYQRVFKCNHKARCLMFITELKTHLQTNNLRERIKGIDAEF